MRELSYEDYNVYFVDKNMKEEVFTQTAVRHNKKKRK